MAGARPARPVRKGKGRNSLTGKGIFGLMRGFPKSRPGRAGHRLFAAAWPSIDSRGFPMKRTYQASKVRRARTHGFLVRMKTRGGRAVINARRAKGRKRLGL